MDNIVEALETGLGIIIFCLGISVMIMLNSGLEGVSDGVSEKIHESRMIGRD